MKFGRIFSMTIQGQTDTYTVESPLTVRFRVMNNSLLSLGSATFLIYNLSADTRNDIYKDAYEILTYRQVVFAAGYQEEPSVPVIFQGNIIQAYSYRQGPDWITQIDALDGGFAVDNASINLTKPSPYTFDDIITDAASAMQPYNLKLGTIGSFDLTNSRGVTFCGSPWDLIGNTVQPFQAQAYIKKETIFVVNQWEYINETGLITAITDNSGMIGSPKLQEGLVKVRMLFEPRIEISQTVELQSYSIPRGGDFKVLSLVHGGTISGAVGETLETEVTLYQPEKALEAA